MTEQEKINGWTFEETVKTAENLMKNEQNMFKWDVLRHLRDFAETFKEELEQYRALGLTPELIEAMQGHNIAMINDLAEYQALGTVEELRVARDKQMAKKLLNDGMRIPFSYYCPSCKEELSDDGYKPDDEYCCNCGQKLEGRCEDD